MRQGGERIYETALPPAHIDDHGLAGAKALLSVMHEWKEAMARSALRAQHCRTKPAGRERLTDSTMPVPG